MSASTPSLCRPQPRLYVGLNPVFMSASTHLYVGLNPVFMSASTHLYVGLNPSMYIQVMPRYLDASTYTIAPLCIVQFMPIYLDASTYTIASPSNMIPRSFTSSANLSLGIFVFFLFTFNPNCAEIRRASSVILSCIYRWLRDNSARSSATSRSELCQDRILHSIPVPFVSVFTNRYGPQCCNLLNT